MTVIAWDGKTLAADKQVEWQGLPRTVTKIFRVGNVLVGVSGDGAQGMDMIEWLRNGQKAEDFPAAQRDEKQWATVVVVREDGAVWVYERTPTPMRLEDKCYATGHGRDFAMAAMYLGKSAREAVEITCVLDVHCGMGIDTLTL